MKDIINTMQNDQKLLDSTPLTWRELNKSLSSLSEDETKKLLNDELATFKRLSIIKRLHQRYNALRVARERVEIMKEKFEGFYY
jgi:arsenate reductase-like glutaredoxin family protein